MNNRGALALPLILLLGVLVTASLLAFERLHRTRRETARQLQLDRCVARAAISLRDSLQRIERMNPKMLALRGAIVAAVLTPEAIPPLRAALTALALSQKASLLGWRARRAAWLTGAGGCGPAVLPELPWHELPPDLIGPLPLAPNPGGTPPPQRVQCSGKAGHWLYGRSLRSAALVSRQLKAGGGWHAAWTSYL